MSIEKFKGVLKKQGDKQPYNAYLKAIEFIEKDCERLEDILPEVKNQTRIMNIARMSGEDLFVLFDSPAETDLMSKYLRAWEFTEKRGNCQVFIGEMVNDTTEKNAGHYSIEEVEKLILRHDKILKEAEEVFLKGANAVENYIKFRELSENPPEEKKEEGENEAGGGMKPNNDFLTNDEKDSDCPF